MAKSSKSTPKAQTKRGTGTRELLKNAAGDFYAKRDGSGQFTELDERGRSLATDRRTKARTVAKTGRGDQGDQQKAVRKKK
jgi:hypothetical protein